MVHTNNTHVCCCTNTILLILLLIIAVVLSSHAATGLLLLRALPNKGIIITTRSTSMIRSSSSNSRDGYSGGVGSRCAAAAGLRLAANSFSTEDDDENSKSSSSSALFSTKKNRATAAAALAADDNWNSDNAERASATTAAAATTTAAFGLYRPFADHAWKRLLQEQGALLFGDAQQQQYPLEAVDLTAAADGNNMGYKEAPAHGGGTVRMTIQALTAATNKSSSNSNGSAVGSVIRYARYALLETIVAQQPAAATATTAVLTNAASSSCGEEESGLQTAGIQVLNLVIFPTAASGLPVFGADFVSLPGNKHLLLLDAQPVAGTTTPNMNNDNDDEHWKEWYDRNAIAAQFPWGGDLPVEVQPYVSKHALWTRLVGGTGISGSSSSGGGSSSSGGSSSGGGGDPDSSEKRGGDAAAAAVRATTTTDPVIQLIQGPVMTAFTEHLEIYLALIREASLREQQQQQLQQATVTSSSSTNKSKSRLPDYVRYRLENDPARPMLKRLYGEEWTEKVLHNVLFPQFLLDGDGE